jgi:hypothetical protein
MAFSSSIASGSRPQPRRSSDRSTAWWRDALEKRRARMDDDKLDLTTPIAWSSPEEQKAAWAFFNAAFRAEESGLRQAHEIAELFDKSDPILAETLRLYGDEEGWHRELLTEFLAYLGGTIKPMGKVTGTFYRLYGRAKRMETIVLVNLMFETIGSTTYRLALGRVKHPSILPMLRILTRDESFHVPLNVHFLKVAMRDKGQLDRLRLQWIYKVVFVALVLSAYASRRRAKNFDHIEWIELARAYAEHLAALFAREEELGFEAPKWVLAWLGIESATLRDSEAASRASIEEAERAVDRASTVVTAL